VRAVLPLALVLLAIAALLERSALLFSPARGSGTGADAALEILAAAKGPLLPAGRLGSGPERFGELVRIGERTFVQDEPGSGLRSVLLVPGRILAETRTFALASEPEVSAALRELVSSAPAGALLVLASSGRIEPGGERAAAARAELERTLQELGARARPFAHTPESWALIALRCDAGWVPLAEGYSRDSGVVLAYTLAREPELAPDRRGELVLVPAPVEAQVFLEDELQHAGRRDAGIALRPDATVGGRRIGAILQPPLPASAGTPAGPSSLAWEGVALGPGSGFLAWVGLADDVADGEAEGGGESGERAGVAFQLLLDGAPVKTLEVPAGERRWRLFQVDLRTFAGRTVELELRVEPLGAERRTAGGERALWGRPVLVHGYERPPLEAWAEGR
jgi:hypothetical protein